MSSLKSEGGFECMVTYKGRPYEGSQAARAFSDFFSLTMKRLFAKTTCSANYVQIYKISLFDNETSIARLKLQNSPVPNSLPALILKGCKELLKARNSTFLI